MSLSRNPPSNLTPKQWIDAVHVGFQERIVVFLLRAYGFLIVTTVGIILLQGFKVKGFVLEASFMKWLGGATIGEIGGLMLVTLRGVFK